MQTYKQTPANMTSKQAAVLSILVRDYRVCRSSVCSGHIGRALVAAGYATAERTERTMGAMPRTYLTITPAGISAMAARGDETARLLLGTRVR